MDKIDMVFILEGTTKVIGEVVRNPIFLPNVGDEVSYQNSMYKVLKREYPMPSTPNIGRILVSLTVRIIF